jgi:hypothetical protein
VRRYRRPFGWTYSGYHRPVAVTPGFDGRPVSGYVVPPLWQLAVAANASTPYAGMDPSDPTTYVRPWNPQPGMVARLNFDGSQVQGETDMGGLWNRPARRKTPVGGRPRPRPR